MSDLLRAQAMRVKGLTPSEKIALYWLADHCEDSTGVCSPRLVTLADLCDMSRDAVTRNIKALVRKGLIERRSRDRRNEGTEYTVRLPINTNCNF